MTLPDLYARSVNNFAALVTQVGDDQWQLSTPCTDWNVRQLVNHLVYEEMWSAPLFDGATIADVGDRFEGDLLGDDPQTTAATAAATATGAVLTPGAMDRTVHLSFGDTPAEEYVSQLFADHVVHGWDLAVAIGADRAIDPDTLAYLVPWFEQREEMYRGGGAIAPRVELGADASEQDRFIAAFGRDPSQ
jgi:uncharacterized protein (TIGR03086 family)